MIMPSLTGFVLNNGVCECNLNIFKVIPNLKCDIKSYVCHNSSKELLD